MENKIKAWLKDIKQAIDEINTFLPDQINYEGFQEDLKKAIE